MKSFDFKYEIINNKRLGYIKTPHGVIETPAFVFCATSAAMKGVLPHEYSAQLVFCNTFHLRKQADIIQMAGGLHKFMNVNFPIITDSGGFQIFSLGHGFVADEIKGIRRRSNSLVKINDIGCEFRCPYSGDLDFFTPDRSINIQYKLGSDFIVVFDECTASSCDYDYTHKSTIRSNLWAEQSIEAYKKYCDPNKQQLYGVIQGGIFQNLRDLSIKYNNSAEVFGFAIGGTLGKTQQSMYEIVNYTANQLEPSKPRHLLGIGKIRDIFELVGIVDTFDCVEPTRIARHGTAIIKGIGNINLKSAKYAKDFTKLDPQCNCIVCEKYTRAYLHHLIKKKEITAIEALVIHNINTMNQLMEDIRYGIKHNILEEIRSNWIINEFNM